MIRFENVSVRYAGLERPAVDGVTIEAPAGSVTAVVGPNGSGKSSLVRALLRRADLVGGAIRVAGNDIATLGPIDIARRVAVVTQREETLFPRHVHEYVALGTYAHGHAGSIERAAARAGVTSLLGRRTDELSGGEWQRVRIARALAQDTAAVVLDEPTSFLDVAHEMQIFELIASLARSGTAVLLVSHQLNLVARFADTMTLLQSGHVVATGTPADVMVASLLERVYEWPLVVSRDPASSAPMLIPLRRSE